MLRTLLTLALITVAAAIGFWFGRQRAAATMSMRARSEWQPPSQAALSMKEPLPNVTLRSEPPPAARLPQDNLPAAPGSDAEAAAPLIQRRLSEPVADLKASDIYDTFYQSRGEGERIHEATDIMAPRGTPVLAMDDGIIKKLFNSKPGGLTIYLFDSSNAYCFYYAHLDRYAEGLKEGMFVKRGTVIGYVGSTGNADLNAPHLHLAILELTEFPFDLLATFEGHRIDSVRPRRFHVVWNVISEKTLVGCALRGSDRRLIDLRRGLQSTHAVAKYVLVKVADKRILALDELIMDRVRV
jgi:murein DD-endopeptidase MepM/ murein hydrolase activator NlpD